MEDRSKTAAKLERITNFTYQLAGWAENKAEAGGTEKIAAAYKALYPSLEEANIRPQDILTQVEPTSAVLAELARAIRQAYNLVSPNTMLKDGTVADPGSFELGLRTYEKNTNKNLFDHKLPDRAGIDLHVRYNAHLGFINETIRRNMQHLGESKIKENPYLGKAGERLAAAWTFAAKAQATGGRTEEKVRVKAIFKPG